MKMKITAAAIGSLLVLAAIYFFPFGQDVLMLWLTQQVGSQVAAWTVMYLICFALIFVGWFMGGLRMLPLSQLGRLFRLIATNPIGFVALMVILFVISQVAFRIMGGP